MKNQFGPNQAAVDQLLERLERVDHHQALFLASFGANDPFRDRARRQLREAARTARRERQLKAAQEEVTRWVNTWFSGGIELSGYTRDITPAQAVVRAAPLVLDAVGALLMRDVISTDDLELPTGPWQELVNGSDVTT